MKIPNANSLTYLKVILGMQFSIGCMLLATYQWTMHCLFVRDFEVNKANLGRFLNAAIPDSKLEKMSLLEAFNANLIGLHEACLAFSGMVFISIALLMLLPIAGYLSLRKIS